MKDIEITYCGKEYIVDYESNDPVMTERGDRFIPPSYHIHFRVTGISELREDGIIRFIDYDDNPGLWDYANEEVMKEVC
jgi:limonene-1,2-epoxide hydrolase